MNNIIKFEKANLTHKEIIFSWLAKPHVQEFWDNSQAHREDILIFLQGRKELSTYFNGIFSYWIALINNEPFALIMTSEIKDEANLNTLWKKHLSTTGKNYSLDYCIGNETYLGKGLAAITLENFTEFFQHNIDSKADTFFIDPAIDNPKALHVYEKAGFKLIGDFIMENGAFAGEKTYLLIKKI